MKKSVGCAYLPKMVGEERLFSSRVQEEGLFGAYVGWRKCAKVGNAWLVSLRGSSGLAEVVGVGGTCSRYGKLGAGDSQKAVGKVR